MQTNLLEEGRDGGNPSELQRQVGWSKPGRPWLEELEKVLEEGRGSFQGTEKGGDNHQGHQHKGTTNDNRPQDKKIQDSTHHKPTECHQSSRPTEHTQKAAIKRPRNKKGRLKRNEAEAKGTKSGPSQHHAWEAKATEQEVKYEPHKPFTTGKKRTKKGQKKWRMMQSNPERSNTGGYVVGELPEELQAEDGIFQEELQHAIAYKRNPSSRMIESFHRSPVKTVPLSTMHKQYDEKREIQALRCLTRRQKVNIDDEYVHRGNDPNLAWGATKHFLDLMLIVCGRPGLDAALPKDETDPSYTFKLDLHQRQRKWRANHCELGFDPAGRLLYIGTYQQEEIWLAMVPRTFTDENANDREDENINMTHLDTPSTVMDEDHFCMLVTFLAQAMGRDGYKDIYFRGERYPNGLTVKELQKTTNLLGNEPKDKNIHEMTYRQVRNLSRRMREDFHDFMANVPDEWLEDRYMVDNVPITIALRYGQNQEICRDGQLEEEAAHWHRLHRYHHVRTMTVALATHIQCVPVAEWVDIETEDIIERHGDEIYDSPLHDTRHEVNLHELDLLDDTGNEQNIYDKDGYRIPRREANIEMGSSTAGMLFKLRNLHRLFEDWPGDDDPEALFGGETTPHYLYPIGCLHDVGQFQARGVLTSFAPLIRRINQTLPIRDDGIQNVVIVPVSSQGYNAYVHQVRSQGRFHDVQRGMMTAAFTGSHMSGGANSHRAAYLRGLCDIALPFDRYHEKISESDFDQSLRMENVFTIKVNRLQKEARNGWNMYVHLIKPLTRMWAHPTVLESIKQNVVLFKQDVLPHVVEWTTYGLCSMLRHLWKRYNRELQHGRRVPHYVVEITAALERALNFAHTGNARVLSRGVMEPLWLSMSMMLDGIPSISPIISLDFAQGISIAFNRSDWPTCTRTGYPETCSGRSITYNYGGEELLPYRATFHILHAQYTLPPTFEATQRDHATRMCSYLFNIALQVHEDDIRNLVKEGVTQSTQRHNSLKTERLLALENWLSIKDKPLGYGNSAYTHLVQAICKESHMLIHGLPMSAQNPQSVSWFAETLISSADSSSCSTHAPFIAGGGGLHVMRAALGEARKYLEHDTDSNHNDIIAIIVKVANKRQIMNIPWSPDRTGGRGRPQSNVVHDVWINLGKPSIGQENRTQFLAPSERRNHAASQSAIAAATSDSRAPWSIDNTSIQDLHQILNHENLPIEWDISHVALSNCQEYVKETYHWVEEHYNGSKPAHQTAILLAIIFSSILPNIMHHKCPEHLRISSSQSTITHAVRTSPWQAPPPGRKGFSDHNPFIVMMSTFIIAMYEPESPLRQYIRTHNGALGASWTDKHGGMSLISAPPS
ncbi:hypothetical protein M404DRAFT_10368 [Pisolithus tinctorius Marx 270]|uniref:DUF8190 domain-containing protein n=1 Tax=Pisolithus tinctorius Marx 270 TaxID=870435 RepID=A0A0C3NVT0_PISTI|nr:hypothetical protein M404DRAFT_10368 [Pisolithus tinctorius Marx 270]